MGLCLEILAMLNSLLRFSCFTFFLTSLLAAMNSTIVSSLLILIFVQYALSIACSTSLLIHDGLLMVARPFWNVLFGYSKVW